MFFLQDLIILSYLSLLFFVFAILIIRYLKDDK